ncbi:MAG TPA: DMT family transporter [Candidatus Angelobacter sp.]|nr:DMT family transporter [Candidatus Angelobacter sp.]
MRSGWLPSSRLCCGDGSFDDVANPIFSALAPGTDPCVKLKKVLIYLAIACCNGTGDVMLKRGMDDLGQIHLSHWTHIFNAFLDPWVLLGITCLAGFFYAYLTALSWADLTYVLPATAFGYVVTAFLSRFFLHEAISPWRWAGVILITCGVGLVARGPSLTERHPKQTQSLAASKEQHELA